MLIIGHRGAKGLAPENTLASFKAALDSGAAMIEFDVRTTKDKEIVVLHDADLKRVSSSPLVVAHSNYADIKKVYPNILTFDEALDFLIPRIPVIIEIKQGTDVAAVVSVLQARMKTDLLLRNFMIASFSFRALSKIKAAIPGAGLVVNEKWSGIRASHRARRLGTKYIAMNERWLWSGFVRAVARGGYKLLAYPLNNPKKAKRFEKAGLHGVITDFPDRF
jgi:glycerophosphoryl diester phosphodiesterase